MTVLALPVLPAPVPGPVGAPAPRTATGTPVATAPCGFTVLLAAATEAATPAVPPAPPPPAAPPAPAVVVPGLQVPQDSHHDPQEGDEPVDGPAPADLPVSPAPTLPLAPAPAVVVPDVQVPQASHHDREADTAATGPASPASPAPASPAPASPAPLSPAPVTPVVVPDVQVPQGSHHDPEVTDAPEVTVAPGTTGETSGTVGTPTPAPAAYLTSPWLLALRLPGGPTTGPALAAQLPTTEVGGAEATAGTPSPAPATDPTATGATDPAPASWPQGAGIRGAEATTPAVSTPAPTTTAPAPMPAVALQVVERIADATARMATTSGTTRITLQLAPEALGEVRVVLTARGGGLQVSLTAGPEARAALQRDGSLLHRMLGDTGASATRVVLRDPVTGAVTATLPTPAAAPAPTHAQAGAASGQLLSSSTALPMGSLPPLAAQDPTAATTATATPLPASTGDGSGSAAHAGGGQHQQDRSARTHPGRPATDGDHLVGADAPASRTRPATAPASGVDVTV